MVPDRHCVCHHQDYGCFDHHHRPNNQPQFQSNYSGQMALALNDGFNQWPLETVGKGREERLVPLSLSSSRLWLL
jgi:hypothetical protein